MEISSETRAPADGLVATLVEAHRDFLAFVERRVGDRATAEDILQSAFVKSLDKLGGLREHESVIAWFYRVLRRAIIDHMRAAGVARRRLDAVAAELGDEARPAPELEREICGCVARIAAVLKPEYAEALRRIDVDGIAVKDFAAELGITASNAGVRIHRARNALRAQVSRACGTCAEHGCFDCGCGSNDH